MDNKSPEKRSQNMAKIRSCKTKPEMFMRSVLHSHGLRFRVNYKLVKGSPDIYFTKKKIAIFIHGCFWHRHPGCKYAYIPKSNLEFWIPKLSQNITRDQESIAALNENGIRVLVIWECTVKRMMKDGLYKNIIYNKILEFINDVKALNMSL